MQSECQFNRNRVIKYPMPVGGSEHDSLCSGADCSAFRMAWGLSMRAVVGYEFHDHQPHSASSVGRTYTKDRAIRAACIKLISM